MQQPGPVMLVIGTFAETKERIAGKDKLEFDQIRWMEISSYLKDATDNGKKTVRQIVFEGKRLDVMAVRHWRDKALKPNP